jgi:DNA end-binding protein Ku
MARAVWSGMISFGLVSVPVGLFTATQEHEPSFHQFAEGTADRIHYKRVNERTGKEVEFGDIVKGVEVGGGKFAMVTDEELAQIAPGRSRALEISGFVALDDIDPIYFNKAYYLAPAGAENKKTYALLRDAMAASHRAGIATFVMHGKEHLAAIRASDNVLVLETLFFADEVRDAKKLLDDVFGKTSFSKGEMAMATQLIESMDETWRPEKYHDSYTDRVNTLIEAKRKGNDLEVAEEAPPATNVVDLMEALQRSVDSARSGRAASKASSAEQSSATKSAAKRAPAKKAPAKRAAAKKAKAEKATAQKATSKKATSKKATSKKAASSAGRTARKAS